MLAKRIIPCLDVKDGQVVKGIQFRQHQVVGEIGALAKQYNDAGADELVFYDITASCDQRLTNIAWITSVAEVINIPFCVAGGIRTLAAAEAILNAGADKISINSPALENPNFIDELVATFGQQCVVVGIDSHFHQDTYTVCQYTGDIKRAQTTGRTTESWIREVQERGAGEIVLNCMNQDGVKKGYDIKQLSLMRKITTIPFIASGGAGCCQDFVTVFQQAKVDAALAASVFHYQTLTISQLKNYLHQHNVEVRP